MKKKRIGWIVIIIVLVMVAIGLGLFIKKYFGPKPEVINRIVYAETGETIPIEELVNMDKCKSATISPKLILTSSFSDAEVRNDGQSVYMGYTLSSFDVLVYVTDEEGEVVEERVTIVPVIRD